MFRALVLISAIVFFREFVLRPARRSPSAISPYMNSLDGLLSAEEVSRIVDEARLRELQKKDQQTFAAPESQADNQHLVHRHFA